MVDSFPDDVIVALHTAAVTFTCVPVQIDGDAWQSAFFYVVAKDAPCLKNGQLPGGPFTVTFDADLHEHDNGTLIEIGIDIATRTEPLRGTMMFLTGHSSTHFEALKLLQTQADIPLFIGDEYCRILWQQRVPLGDEHRQGFASLLDEAVSRDVLIRLTGRYDPDVVFADVLAKRGVV